jgi:hypothetical protein
MKLFGLKRCCTCVNVFMNSFMRFADFCKIDFDLGFLVIVTEITKLTSSLDIIAVWAIITALSTFSLPPLINVTSMAFWNFCWNVFLWPHFQGHVRTFWPWRMVSTVLDSCHQGYQPAHIELSSLIRETRTVIYTRRRSHYRVSRGQQR